MPQILSSCTQATRGVTLEADGKALPIVVAPEDSETLRLAAQAFAGDMQAVTGVRPMVTASPDGQDAAILLGILGHSPLIDALAQAGKIDVAAVRGKWESAVIETVEHPTPTLQRALVIAGSDRRGAAFALFGLSRAMGVSPWNWWADVPAKRRTEVCVASGRYLQGEPSVPYRGIFLNDEDWGLRPWAAGKMDPELGNIGPNTYTRIFELLLRLHANTLCPAMHPGTLAFNAVAENARLADRWGIVMGSSHSEALLRNNVGEWDEKRDGPWNYQTNREKIDRYWDERLKDNGRYENFYTIGMRGVHDTGLEATGSAEVKARLVEEVMASQRAMLRARVDPDLDKVPQVIWLYKESLELYRAGMKVPDDVTLGWTDDNYGYLRQLPTAAEQQRKGGSAIYYHVSYWGFPHDYLWLCTTPPALIREEMTKAWDHGARRLWILNVGDIKPAEADIDYFLQLAWKEPETAEMSQREFLQRWYGEQFPAAQADRMASAMEEYYRLNFIRKPEFMGFNGYDDGVKRTSFNPLAWGDENQERMEAWRRLSEEVERVGNTLPAADHDAYFELVAYPVEAAAAQNEKFLWTDRSYLDASRGELAQMRTDGEKAQAAYDRIQMLTRSYNTLAGGKWQGMMDAAPRKRNVFAMPAVAQSAEDGAKIPPSWGAGSASAASGVKPNGTLFLEREGTVSINAAHFSRKHDLAQAHWRVLDDLGISGASVVLGVPGAMESAKEGEATAWLEYDFSTGSSGDATLAVSLLPTFPVDSAHLLRFAVSLDGGAERTLDLAGAGEWHENSAPVWAANVLRNAAVESLDLGPLRAGRHTLRFTYIDPGVVFEHVTVSFPGAPPAYPCPPETRSPSETRAEDSAGSHKPSSHEGMTKLRQ